MRNSKINSEIFSAAQLGLIAKFKNYFKFELAEVQSEAWLTLIDLNEKGRDASDFEGVLWSRLKDIHKSTFMGHHIFAADLLPDEFGDCGLEHKMELETLIDSLPENSLAAQAIERCSGLSSCVEFGQNEGLAERTAQRFVEVLVAESQDFDLFSAGRIEGWKPPKTFKKAKECPNLVFEPLRDSKNFFGVPRFSPPLPPVEKIKTVLPIARKRQAQILKVEHQEIELQLDFFKKAA